MNLASIQELIASKVSRLIPESDFKNRLSCIYSNSIERNNFSVKYKNGSYLISFNGVTLKLLTKHAEDVFNLGYLDKYRIKEGDVVVDGGAFVGAFAIYAAKIVGERGKVIAFEPDKYNYNILLKTIRLNKLMNIIPLNKGLWCKSATLRFRSSNGENSSLFFEDSQSSDIIDVDVVSLDDELSALKIRKLDFIKMDIEGAELEAIKGAKDLLENNDVNLAIASYHIIDGVPTYFKLREILSSMNYYSEIGFPTHLTVYGRPHNSRPLDY
jgi:FkbM family methyltransferase